MIQLLIIGVIVCLFFFVQYKVYSEYWYVDLEVDLSFQPTDVFEGDEGCLSEVIVNDKLLPLPLFNVKFQTDRNLLFQDTKVTQKTDQYYRNDAFRIGGHEKITRNLSFVAGKRGYYHIQSIDFETLDLFMTNIFSASQKEDKYLYVYPKPFYSREFLRSLQMVNGMMQTRRQFLEDPFEYRGIREYQPYDDMKSINWKATAKTDDYKVNLHDFTAVKSIRIFLNLEDEGILKKEDCAEVCIQMAAGISKFFSEKGMKVSCYGNCKDSLTDKVLSLDENSSLQDISRALARIDLSKEVVNFQNYYENRILTKNNGGYTFIVSVNAYDDFVSLLQKYHRVSGDFIWFYPMNQHSSTEIPQNLRTYFRPININQIS